MAAEPLLDLGRQVHRVRGKGFKIQLSLVERVRVTRGYAQAVVKIVSYAKGFKRVRQLVDYISRKGTLDLETESGDKVIGREEGQQLAENWSGDFDMRKNSRDAVHVVFSMPKGSDPEALKRSVRVILDKQFPARQAVFGIHQDKSHPHAHVVLKMRGRNSEKKLSLNKPEIYRLREAFAEAARENGVQLAASPRAARGVGTKGKRQALFYMRQRGIKPDVDRQAVRETMQEFKSPAKDPKPWEKAIKDRYEKERAAYLASARALREAAAGPAAAHRDRFLKEAEAIQEYANKMRKPKTRRQIWMERLAQKFDYRAPERNVGRSQETELER